MLLKEHRFKFLAGAEAYLFTIEELVTGLAVWPQRFRLKLPASSRSEAKTFYGASCYEAAEKASDFISRNSGQSGIDRATHLSQGPPVSPRSSQGGKNLDRRTHRFYRRESSKGQREITTRTEENHDKDKGKS